MRKARGMLFMRSPKAGPKPATVVICEGASFSEIGLRERRKGEDVHHRNNDECSDIEASLQPCAKCGMYGGVWMETIEGWANHDENCLS